MRVAQVNDIAYVATTLAEALRAMGHHVDVIEPRHPGAGLPYPWRLATLPLRAAGLVEAALRVRRGRYDAVHVHFARLGIVGPLAGVPYVLHCHGTDMRGVAPRSPWGLEVAPALRHARRVYYATPDLARWVLPFRADARFLPNPIDLTDFPLASRPPERDLLVGVRLDPIKGLEAVVQLVGRVVELRPRTTVTIVDQGGGVEKVQAAAGPLSLVIPRVEHQEVANLFAAHRLAVGQQLVGALGNYELEAMAAGLPVVTAFRYQEAYDEPPPIVGGSSGDAVREVVRLLDDEEGRAQLGGRARAWIAAHHGAESIAARVVRDYLEIAAR